MSKTTEGRPSERDDLIYTVECEHCGHAMQISLLSKAQAISAVLPALDQPVVRPGPGELREVTLIPLS